MIISVFLLAFGFVICLTAITYVYFATVNHTYAIAEENHSNGEIEISFSTGNSIKTPLSLSDGQEVGLPVLIENTNNTPITYSFSLNHIVNNIKYEIIRNDTTIKSGELKEGESEALVSNAFLEGEETHRYIVIIHEN